ncbi:MAG: class I SAM-dependent methyltransferase [Actinobacteria bacterium]|nr:class I SAM-dependent methyltransferase [Actinomycetota bacterium]MBU4205245.1 class I SAM-dependent methyltransferase [Actinomycetota bacterium]MBU4251146.1 class I SAM-dependent methyltransferase [Actinomycetota bacterium]MBU4416273.1 class I SAM-dependent methyltransferase [Actinomycetota bacterium]MBU4589187.1 class I SAM-dependent methyltransferase [Actinomycetota bacterium]
MTRLLAALDRINQRHPWSHNDAFSGFVLRHAKRTIREGGTTALDVGCGTGNLLRRLAPLFPQVVGVEAHPETAARAAAAVLPWPTVTVVNAPFPADSHLYDFVSMVAVLHHLPLVGGIKAARAAVAPGGRLVIVGVYREEAADAPFSFISLALNPLIGLLRHPQPSVRLPQGMSAPTASATDCYQQIKEALKAELPGVKVHRTLFWRYLAIWQNQRSRTA